MLTSFIRLLDYNFNFIQEANYNEEQSAYNIFTSEVADVHKTTMIIQ